MTQIIMMAITFMVLVAVLTYLSRAHTFIKLVVLPFALITMMVALNFYTSQLGRPIYEKPAGEFAYVMHKVVGNHVELVVADKLSPRLYIFTSSKSEEEALDKMKTKGDKGVKTDGKFVPNSDNNSEGQLEFWEHKVPMKDL